MKLNDMLGKEVKIYPGDTYPKYGIIEDITNEGILFRITEAHSKSDYEADDIVFISFSARLTFKERK